MTENASWDITARMPAGMTAGMTTTMTIPNGACKNVRTHSAYISNNERYGMEIASIVDFPRILVGMSSMEESIRHSTTRNV